jgi:hypothetical protein
VKPFVFAIIVVLVAIAVAGDVWGKLGMPFMSPLLLRLAGLQGLVILGQGALVKANFVRGIPPGRFLAQLVALNVAALAAYLSHCLGSGWELLVGAISIGAGVNFFIVLRALHFPRMQAADKTPNRPDSRTGLRTLKQARALVRAALPAGDPGLYWGGAFIRSALARFGFLLVGAISTGTTTLLRLLLQSKRALPAIRPGTDCRAWILDPKLEMVPIARGIVGKQCPVIVMLPTDLRSRKWRVSEDIKDEASCWLFAALLMPAREGERSFWRDIARTLISAALIYLVRTKVVWDLRDLVLILDDEELIRQVLDRVAGKHYVSQFFDSKWTRKSIKILLAGTMADLRLIAAMWDHAPEEVSLDWWSKNPAIVVVGTDPAFAKTLNALIRMMFKRTSELLLARSPDPTGQRFNWLVLDDVTALGPLDGLSELCIRGRAAGCVLVTTLHVVGSIRELYKEQAGTLLDQFPNRALLRTDDVETAHWASEMLGPEGSIEKGLIRPVFSPYHFLNMGLPGRCGLQGVWTADLGESFIDRNGDVRDSTTAWSGVLSPEETFDQLVPPAADTAGFIPRPPEHRVLRPFTDADYRRLRLTPPSGS